MDDDHISLELLFWIIFAIGLFLTFISFICACRRSCQTQRGVIISEPVRNYGGTNVTVRTAAPVMNPPYTSTNRQTTLPGSHPVSSTYHQHFPPYPITPAYPPPPGYEPAHPYRQAPPSYYEATSDTFPTSTVHEGYMKQSPYNLNMI